MRAFLRFGFGACNRWLPGGGWFRALRLGVWASCLTACTLTHELEVSPALKTLPAIEPRPQSIGVYLSDEFVAATVRRVSGPHVFVVPLGAASSEMLLAALPKAFARTERVDDTRLAADHPAAGRLDAIIEARIEDVGFRGLLKAGDCYGVTYRFNVYSPGGVPVGSWLVGGRSSRDPPPFSTIYVHLKDDIEEAGKNLLQGIERGAFEPFLAPLAAIRQRGDGELALTAGDFDLALESMAAAEVSPRLASLAGGGPLAVRVSITNNSSQPVLVRDNDIRLQIGNSGPLPGLSAETVVHRLDRAGRAVEATAGMMAGSSGLGVGVALGAMIVGAAAITAEEDAIAAERRQLRQEIRSRLFGERSIAPREKVSGAVLFSVPEKIRHLEAGTLSLWLLRPPSGESLQLSRPVKLPGLVGTVSRQ